MKAIPLNYALIFAVILQAIGLIWYVSKLDSKVETVYKFYQEESQKSVVVNQAKMKFDLALVMKRVTNYQGRYKRKARTNQKRLWRNMVRSLNSFRAILKFLQDTNTSEYYRSTNLCHRTGYWYWHCCLSH